MMGLKAQRTLLGDVARFLNSITFVPMETMTITVKTKKAKRIIEDLEALDVLNIVKNGKGNTTPKETIMDPKKVDLNWLDPKKRPHARKILRGLKEAQMADQGEIKLKSAKEFLNEI
jgi:hypothetical protein